MCQFLIPLISFVFYCFRRKPHGDLTKYQNASQQIPEHLPAFAAGLLQSGNLVKYPFVFAVPGQFPARSAS